jgi:RNA polymerase sigma-70 factor (ECF subfamily)
MSAENPALDSAVHNLQQDAGDDAAWAKLVKRYQGRITAWCLKQGLQLADAENVSQEVLARLTRKIHMYDPKKGPFPTWLRRVTIHVCSSYRRKQLKAPTGTGDTAQMMRLHEVEDDTAGFWEGIDAAGDRDLLQTALVLAQAKVSREAWAIFRMAALEKVAGPDIASQLGITAQSVYSTRHRVLLVVKETLAELGAGE